MKPSTLKIALAVITTVGTIAVAAVSLLSSNEPTSQPSIVVSPNMTQSNVNKNTVHTPAPNPVPAPVPATTTVIIDRNRRPVINNYIIEGDDTDSDQDLDVDPDPDQTN